MHTVLVPFDGSASAKRAIQYLIDFSKDFTQLKVHVLNVQTEPVIYGEYVTPDLLDQLQAGALQHAAEINAEAAVMLAAAKIDHETHVATGMVAPEIGRAVTDHGCSAVVMGTRGMGSLKNLVLGSVATQVVHEVAVPVTLVK